MLKKTTEEEVSVTPNDDQTPNTMQNQLENERDSALYTQRSQTPDQLENERDGVHDTQHQQTPPYTTHNHLESDQGSRRCTLPWVIETPTLNRLGLSDECLIIIEAMVRQWTAGFSRRPTWWYPPDWMLSELQNVINRYLADDDKLFMHIEEDEDTLCRVIIELA